MDHRVLVRHLVRQESIPTAVINDHRNQIISVPSKLESAARRRRDGLKASYDHRRWLQVTSKLVPFSEDRHLVFWAAVELRSTPDTNCLLIARELRRLCVKFGEKER